MRFWALILRILGLVWFGWIVITNFKWLIDPYSVIGLDARGVAVENILQAAVTAALCFGVASGLDKLTEIEGRVSRQNAVMQHSKPELPVSKKRDLAPVAPANWQEFKPRPPEPEKDPGYEQRMAQRGRYRVRRTAGMRHTQAAARTLVQDIKDGDDNQDDKKRPVYPSKKRV